MKVLFLAGGYDQIAFIQELKNRGFFVGLVDYTKHPAAEPFADVFFCVSTLDIVKVEEITRQGTFDMVLTACTDQALLTMATVSENLGLPCYLSKEQAQLLTNKYYMKQRMIQTGIPTAKCCFVTNLDNNIVGQLGEMHFPMVVKPCDCNSSKGVIKVHELDTLYAAVSDDLKMSRDHKVVIEEYQAGREFSVDFWLSRQEARILGISHSEKKKGGSAFTITRSVYPVERLDDYKAEQIRVIGEKIGKAFNIQNAPLLVQMIDGVDGVSVIEFSARMGGGTKYRLIEYMSGVDVVRVFLDMVTADLQSRPSYGLHPYMSGKFYELDYLYAFPGVIRAIHGLEELLNRDVVKEVYYYKNTGDAVADNKTSSDRVAGVLIEGADTQEIFRKRKILSEEVHIISQEDYNIFCKEFLET